MLTIIDNLLFKTNSNKILYLSILFCIMVNYFIITKLTLGVPELKYLNPPISELFIAP